MTLDFMTCECGKAHLRGACYCDRCGAQPPRSGGTGRQQAEVPEEESAAFVAGCVALGEALVGTGGKWGVA